MPTQRLDRVFLKSAAGLQAGILAGTVMLGWIVAASWAHGQSAWTIPNLLAATFYGGRAYRPDFHWRTWSGLGLHFVCAGTLGVVFSIIRPVMRHAWITALLGLVFALGVYAFVAPWVLDQLNGPLLVYSRQGFMLTGYCLFGVLLATVHGFRKRESERLGGEEPDAAGLDPDGVA